ncbi:cytochrome b561 [Alteromonadaceae bacterium Bs31]|nr:cytochrome b561 [Alteromonadaceae bacterium Bs31]
MRLGNTNDSYGLVAVLLHWVTALAVVFLFALGLWMVDLDYYNSWYQLAPNIHKSVGFVLVLAVLFRLFWRLSQLTPQSPATHKAWERMLAKLMHVFFYIAIISMFFSGYFITTGKGQALHVLGFISIPAVIDNMDNVKDIASEVHEISAYTIIVAVALHALAAIKHHFIDKDKTLARMLGR